jgi:hypothetical protein
MYPASPFITLCLAEWRRGKLLLKDDEKPLARQKKVFFLFFHQVGGSLPFPHPPFPFFSPPANFMARCDAGVIPPARYIH